MWGCFLLIGFDIPFYFYKGKDHSVFYIMLDFNVKGNLVLEFTTKGVKYVRELNKHKRRY